MLSSGIKKTLSNNKRDQKHNSAVGLQRGEKKDKTSACLNVCMHTHKCANTQRGVIAILTEAHTVNRARYNYTQ